MKESALEHYIRDTFLLLKEEAKGAKKQHMKMLNTQDSAYWAGFLSAYHDVISLLQSQADVFDLSLLTLGLDDIKPEAELLSSSPQ